MFTATSTTADRRPKVKRFIHSRDRRWCICRLWRPETYQAVWANDQPVSRIDKRTAFNVAYHTLVV